MAMQMMSLSPVQRKVSYVSLVLLWALVIYNFICPFTNTILQLSLYWGGIAIIVVHFIEVFIFYSKLKAETPKVQGVLMLFFFGIVYASGL
jgi:uncharacterized protein YhhL (DUF1145 family)